METVGTISNTRRPVYCTVCGSKLATVGNVYGYDAFTGESVSEEHLVCNNTTVSVSNGLITNKVVTTRHPSWTFDSGQWVSN